MLFWDQLDWIGVNAFYPLARENGASDATYAASAAAALDELGELAAVLDMPVVLVEIGYTTRRDAAVEPWLWPDGMRGVIVDEREQARALAAIAEAAARRRDVLGFFVWRYYANLDDVSQEAVWGFSPHAKLAEGALERIFARRWAADPKAVAFGGSAAGAARALARAALVVPTRAAAACAHFRSKSLQNTSATSGAS